MKTVNIIESATELVEMARKSKPNECRGKVLPEGCIIVIDENYTSVRLTGKASEGFELSDNVTLEYLMKALVKQTNLTINFYV